MRRYPISRTNRNRERPITYISNEVEFNLHAQEPMTERIVQNLIERRRERGLCLMREVNPRHVVELNISMARSLDELNARLAHDARALHSIARELGIALYGGSNVLETMDDVEYTPYRTACLSRTLGRYLCTVSSLQLVVGIRDEEVGLRIYNNLIRMRTIDGQSGLASLLYPSSPLMPSCTYSNGELHYAKNCISQELGNPTNSPRRRLWCRYERGIDTFSPMGSNRINTLFQIAIQCLPPIMVFPREVRKLSDYNTILERATREINIQLNNRTSILDLDWERLQQFLPIEHLEPHQVYFWVRLRPDHAENNLGSGFSIEIRITDMPYRLEMMQRTNAILLSVIHTCATQPFMISESIKHNIVISAMRHALESDWFDEEERLEILRAMEKYGIARYMPTMLRIYTCLT